VRKLVVNLLSISTTIATESLQSKLDAEFQTTSRRVRKSISTFLGHFVKMIEPKIKDVHERLEFLAKQKMLWV
jgi:hypothetical protein